MLTRRELLKLGLLGGGYTALASGSGLRGVFADDELPASPKLSTDRSYPLPLPPPPPEVPAFLSSDCGPDGGIGTNTKFFIGANTRFFKLVEEEASVSLHPDLLDTVVWRYRPMFFNTATHRFEKVTPWNFALGPTFNVRIAQHCGEGVVVPMRNELPANHVGFGVPETTTHLHGGHHLARSDGFPDNTPGIGFTPVIKHGEEFDYIYPMLDPGFRAGVPDHTERGSTLWYHDHLFDFTGPNVQKGLAGFYLVFDDLDTGDEATGLRLPANKFNGSSIGPFDIPLVIQDRRVGSDGQIIFDALDHDGFLGDVFLVNGAVQPKLDVKRRRYRFRFLNGSNARFYRIFLTNFDRSKTFPMDQIATEGGLLSAPIRDIRNFQIAPAERVEVVADFSSFSEGTKLFFENRLVQTDGRHPDNVVSQGPRLLQLIVGGAESGPDRAPNVLRPFDKISDAEQRSAIHREVKFDRSDGAWTINGQLADLERPMIKPSEGQGEIWHLDSGGGWAHPVHIHLEYMRVLRRDGNPPPQYERDGIARKDTVVIGAGFGNVDIFIKFRDYLGPFVFHCHNIEHEDMRMMARMDIVPPKT